MHGWVGSDGIVCIFPLSAGGGGFILAERACRKGKEGLGQDGTGEGGVNRRSV